MPEVSQWQLDTCSLKGDGEWNEDALVIHENASVYGVVDGATSLSAYRNPEGWTGGYVAAQLAAAHFMGMDPNGKLEQTAAEANQALWQRMLAEGVDTGEASNLWSAALVMVQIREHSIDYVQAGDCMLLAKYKDGTVRALTHPQLAHVDRRTLKTMAHLRAEGIDNPAELRRRLLPHLKGNRALANTMGGYGIMNGDPRFPLFLEKGTFNRANLESLYMFSDGLYTETSGWTALTEVLDRLGAKRYAGALYEKEQKDRMLLEVPRLKVSDDKTCVVLRLG